MAQITGFFHFDTATLGLDDANFRNTMRSFPLVIANIYRRLRAANEVAAFTNAVVDDVNIRNQDLFQGNLRLEEPEFDNAHQGVHCFFEMNDDNFDVLVTTLGFGEVLIGIFDTNDLRLREIRGPNTAAGALVIRRKLRPKQPKVKRRRGAKTVSRPRRRMSTKQKKGAKTKTRLAEKKRKKRKKITSKKGKRVRT